MSSSSRDSGSRIIVALDYPAASDALTVVDRLEPGQCRLKIGFELFTRAGPALVERLIAKGFDVFLDMKYHDIPNTVAGACRAASELGVWMVNVHALGGERMMAAAREAVDRSGHRPRLIAVTILTSHSAAELAAIGLPGEPQDNVLRLAAQAAASGLDGVVCSAHEAAGLRARQGADFLLVTPGIRPAGSGSQDQSRVMTPTEAVARGADYLVIGRPITHAADPAAAVREINTSLAGMKNEKTILS